MTILRNTAEGGTNGAVVTDANSGGASGDAFDVVSNTPYYTNVSPILGDMSILCDGSGSDFVTYKESLPNQAEAWARIVGRVSALPGGNSVICDLRESGGSVVGTDIRLKADGAIQLRPNFIAEYTSAAVITAGVIFRLEIHLVSHPSAGHVEGRLFLGANALVGTTPDVVFGNWAANHNTGDGEVGAVTAGWVTNPSGSPSLIIDEFAYSNEGWLGPPVTGPKGIQNPMMGLWSNADTPLLGGGPASPYDSILVPTSGAWFGAVVAAQNAFTTSTTTGLSVWNSMTGIRPPDILGIYKVGDWNGTFSSQELAMLANSGGGKPSIPHVRWKPGNTGSPGTFKGCADGNYDAELDAAFTALKAYGGKVMLSIWHEPEDNTGPTNYSTTDFVNMWRRCHDRAAAVGADNIIWVLNYMGYSSHRVKIIAMYPGDAYVDWVAFDPYVEGDSRNTLEELLNEDQTGNWAPIGYDGFYDYFTTNHPTKPLMLAEFGVDGGPDSAHGTTGSAVSEAEAIAIINNWKANKESYPAVKAWQYWHAEGTGDYQITGRTNGETEFKAFVNDSYFDQDTTYAVD